MFECRLAYRFDTDEVEGFKGIALTSKEKARGDALEQINRKLHLVGDALRREIRYEPLRLIESQRGLTTEEMNIVRADWGTTVRY